jgi:intein/homing endonuclease
MLLSRSDRGPGEGVDLKRVERVFVHPKGRILQLRAGGRVVRTTPEHPFYVRATGWVPVATLKIGDALVCSDGRDVPIEDLLDTGETETVFNLSVRDHHTYFVGSNSGTSGFWVHNKQIGDVPSPIV